MHTLSSMDAKELLETAQEMAAFPSSAVTNGNTIVLFAMLILERTLAQQAAVTPVNTVNLVALSNSIASLNSSIRVLS